MQIRDHERATVETGTVRTQTSGPPKLPRSRGPVSAAVFEMLARPTTEPGSGWLDDVDHNDALVGDDFHLALYVLYELHYRSFPALDDRLEWDPRVLRVRGELEERFERA